MTPVRAWRNVLKVSRPLYLTLRLTVAGLMTAALAINPSADLMVNHNSLGDFKNGNHDF